MTQCLVAQKDQGVKSTMDSFEDSENSDFNKMTIDWKMTKLQLKTL